MPKDAKTGAVDLSGEKIHWSPSGGLTYGSYLGLDQILNTQKPLSEHPDEMLFIVIHQVTEQVAISIREGQVAISIREGQPSGSD